MTRMRVKNTIYPYLGIHINPELGNFIGNVYDFELDTITNLYRLYNVDSKYSCKFWYFHPDWLESIEEISPAPVTTLQYPEQLIDQPRVDDQVNAPTHYQFGKYEPIKVIQDWDLSFSLGNVVKYIARAGRKDSSKLIEDLEKAKRYLELELEDLRNKHGSV